MQIENNTPFAAATLPMWHRNRKIHPILVIKTGYRWNDEGQLSALTQDEIIIEPVDRYTNDDAENASLEASADMVPFKNGFELLASGQIATVKEAAFMVGFTHVGYFIRRFEEFYGQTPGSIAKREEER